MRKLYIILMAIIICLPLGVGLTLQATETIKMANINMEQQVEFTTDEGTTYIWYGQGSPDIKNLEDIEQPVYGPMPEEYYKKHIKT